MKKGWLVTAGFVLMAIIRLSAQESNCNEIASCAATMAPVIITNSSGLVKKYEVTKLKRNINTQIDLVHAKKHAGPQQQISLQTYKGKHRVPLYTGLPLSGDHLPGNYLTLVSGSYTSLSSGSKLTYDERQQPVAPEKTSALSRFECGLDNSDGLSIGLSGSACLSLDVMGYFSDAADTSTEISGIPDSINNGSIDHNVTVGIVLEIR